MGIESVGQGCKGLWVATGMEGAIVACCAMRIFFKHAVPGAKKWGVGVASLAGAREVVVPRWHT